MSERNLEVVRRIYGEWSRGNFQAGMKHFGEEVVLVMAPDLPDAGTYTGIEQLRGYTRSFLSAWERVEISGKSFLAEGDSVLVEVHQRGTGRGSGVPTEMSYFHVWRFRGEEVIRIETVTGRAEALEAVGLPE